MDNLNGASVVGRTIRVEHVLDYRKKREEMGDELGKEVHTVDELRALQQENEEEEDHHHHHAAGRDAAGRAAAGHAAGVGEDTMTITTKRGSNPPPNPPLNDDPFMGPNSLFAMMREASVGPATSTVRTGTGRMEEESAGGRGPMHERGPTQHPHPPRHATTSTSGRRDETKEERRREKEIRRREREERREEKKDRKREAKRDRREKKDRKREREETPGRRDNPRR